MFRGTSGTEGESGTQQHARVQGYQWQSVGPNNTRMFRGTYTHCLLLCEGLCVEPVEGHVCREGKAVCREDKAGGPTAEQGLWCIANQH